MTRVGMALVAACLTLTDMKNRDCATACHIGGWETGAYSAPQDLCWCMDPKPYKTMMKKMLIPRQVRLPLSNYEPPVEKTKPVWQDAQSPYSLDP